MKSPLTRLAEVENKVKDLQNERTTVMNVLSAHAEMLSGALERIQELEAPKHPRTHFSGRPPEVKEA
jgi:hypothetical protein